MKYVLQGDTASGKAASLRTVLEAAGVHNWSEAAALRYMAAEAKKFRPNFGYHLSQYIPLSGSPAQRIQKALQAIIIGSMLIFMATFMLLWAFHVADNIRIPVGARVQWWLYMLKTYSLLDRETALIAFGSFATFMLFGLFEVYFGDKLNIRHPAVWTTVPLTSEHTHLMPKAALDLYKRVDAMVVGTTFEISLLSQDKEILDPVMWVSVKDGGTVYRTAIMIWDKNMQIVFPS